MLRSFLAPMTAIALAALASAEPLADGALTIESFPTMAVSDGRSQVTLTVRVQDSNGNLVPDGTQVVLETSLGILRDKVGTTRSGLVQTVLTAPSIAGMAKVRASAFQYQAFGETEVEFVADRNLLSTAREFIEVVGSETLQYSVQDRIVEATGAERGAVLRYRDIEIEADDLQLRVPSYEVKARRARIKVQGRYTGTFDQLYFRLNRRSGFAIGEYVVPQLDVSGGAWPHGLPLKPRTRYGVVELSSVGISPGAADFDSRLLDFQDLAETISMVEAEKVVAFPRREVQFHQANVKLTGQSIMKLPLFRVSVNTSSPLITEQFVNVTNNRLAVNYPYYLMLKPGMTSALRLRYGNLYGGGIGATGGTYMDYELNWNRGDEMEGGLTVFGLARKDWGVGIRQSFMLSDQTLINAQLDFPAHRSLFATAGISKPFEGFNASLNANYGQNIGGSPFQTQNTNFMLEKDPIKIGTVPGNLFLGLTAGQNRISNEFTSYEQESVGLQARFVSDTFRFDRDNSLNFSYTISQLSGENVRQGLTQGATVNWASSSIPNLLLNVSYDFLDDGFSSQLLGRHKLNVQSYYSLGDFTMSGYFSKSLDFDRLSANATAGYRMSPLWRFSYRMFMDQYATDMFFDQAFIVSYRLGFRELGLSYSHRTKRIGIEILGTSF